MDRKFADEMIEKFRKKFFGYALQKTSDVGEAEELAARIVCEAYITLRSVEDVYNWDGYLYRIASNVYARYVDERRRNAGEDIDELEVSAPGDFFTELVREEELALLRREVAWLGKRHREIILLHYYHGRKIEQISEILDIPVGTVKWHLSDARSELKKGIKKMRTSGRLGLEPIIFAEVSHDGRPGKMGGPEVFLNTRLSQNIVYAAYFEPKSVEEIAAELGVSPVFVEDEAAYLEEYGFLDLVQGKKYLANVFITDLPGDVLDSWTKIDQEIAREVGRQYVPVLQKKFAEYQKFGLYVPEGDMNYLLWSLVPLAVSQAAREHTDQALLEHTHYMAKRKDGGQYIALALILREDAGEEDNHYAVCGDMFRDKGNAASWSIGTDFDTRESGWEDNQAGDCGLLHLYMEGKLPKIEALADKYVRLYRRGLLAQEEGRDEVNVIVARQTPQEGGGINPMDTELMREIPDFPEELCTFIRGKCEEKVRLAKQYYPAHMYKLLEYRHQFEVDRIRVLDELLESGVLRPLSERQKKGVMTVVYSDILPEE